MPGLVTIVEALGAPTIPASQDFAVVAVGYSTASPLSAGLMSSPYSSSASFASVFGIGDGADLLTQAITPTQGNPKPPPVCFYRTPATTPGVRGATLATTIASGRITVTKTATTPVGTFEPRLRCVTGCTLGTAGGVFEYSPDNGRTYLPSQQLGTATTLKMQIAGTDTGVQFDFAFSGITGTADITDAGLYGVGGDLDTLTLILNVNGGGATTLTLDIATNAASKAALLAAIAVAWPTLTATDVSTHLHLADSVATGSIVVGAGTANTLLGLTAGTYAGTFTAGDLITESITTGPMWTAADLYAAGPPATGMFAALGASGIALAIIAFADPVTSGDFPTLTAGLDYLASLGKRCAILARFRPRASDETDATWSAAFQAFCLACSDNRISIVCGEGWLTDAFRGYRYFRSGLPAVLARMQSFEATPGSQGERMAQHPGWVSRGPLENFSIVDDATNPLSFSHDEKLSGGIDGPFGGRGGGITFYYNRIPSLSGTYVSEAPVRYAPLSRCLTWMDRRVLNGIETTAEAFLWLSIQGADLLDGNQLDASIAEAQASTVAGAIKDRYSREFQNASDPNLVKVNQTVVVNGSQVQETATCTPKLYGYTYSITLTVSASRG